MPIHSKLTDQEKKAHEAFNKSRMMGFHNFAMCTSILGLVFLSLFIHSDHSLSTLVWSIVFFTNACVLLIFFIKEDQRMKRDDVNSYMIVRRSRIIMYFTFLICYCVFLIAIIVMP